VFLLHTDILKRNSILSYSVSLMISNFLVSIFVSLLVQGGNVLGKQFQKMRRRLTVTGASQSIDGVVKPGVAESGDLKKYKGKKQDKVCNDVFVVFDEKCKQSHLLTANVHSIMAGCSDDSLCRH
jgi:hypothetical protein